MTDWVTYRAQKLPTMSEAERHRELAYVAVKAISAYDRLVALCGSEAKANALMANCREDLKKHSCCITTE